jgi:hypothetical protein
MLSSQLSSAHVLVGEPVSTSPERALEWPLRSAFREGSGQAVTAQQARAAISSFEIVATAAGAIAAARKE